MSIKNSVLTLSATGVLAFGLAACGGDDDATPAAGGSGTETTQAEVTPAAQVDNLTGVDTQVTLDSGFVDALGSLNLTPAPVGDATIEDGVAAFPITGGNVTYYTPGSRSPYVTGEIDHEGSGLSLTADGGPEVELTDFVVDPGASVLTGKVTVDGTVAAESAPLFFLDGRTLNPLETGPNNTAILEGTTVKLKQEAADLLNQTFDVDALQAGLVIGIAKITVNTQ